VVELSIAAIGRNIANNAIVMGILAGEEGRPRRGTQWKAAIEVAEGGALVAYQYASLWHHAQLFQCLIIGHNDDNVRPRCRGYLRRKPTRSSKDCGTEQNYTKGRQPRYPSGSARRSAFYRGIQHTCILQCWAESWRFHGEYAQVIAVPGYSEAFCLVKE
jgi:hypothetical protein